MPILTKTFKGSDDVCSIAIHGRCVMTLLKFSAGAAYSCMCACVK